MAAGAVQKTSPVIESLNDIFTVNCSLIEMVNIEHPHFSRIPQLFTLWFTAGHRGLMGYERVRQHEKTGWT